MTADAMAECTFKPALLASRPRTPATPARAKTGGGGTPGSAGRGVVAEATE